MFNFYPSPVLDALRTKLVAQNKQREDGRYQAGYREDDGGKCSYLNPKNRTVVGFFLACFSGLVIGLYLIDKGGELMAKTSNLRALLRSPPVNWPLERKLKYLEWSKSVLAGVRGTNSWLEAEFDKAAADLAIALGKEASLAPATERSASA